MSEKITIEADEVWDYFQENKSVLTSKMHLIAENQEYGIEIYLTEHNKFPQIIVEADKMQVFEAGCLNKSDCEETVRDVYEKYLTKEAFETLYPNEESIDEEIQAEMEEDLEIEIREEELDTAIETMLDAFIGGEGVTACFDEAPDIIADLKEIVGAYLFLKWGIEPYRPMVIEYDDGTEEYDEYPYSSLDLEEYEKNPIFMQ